MADPKDLLEPAAYRNYRNVRAAAAFFILLGGLVLLGGIASATGPEEGSGPPPPLVVSIGLALAGLAGVVGGIVIRRGGRGWSPLIWVTAVVYLLFFPLGTLLGYVVLKGLPRYWESVQRIREEAVPGN